MNQTNKIWQDKILDVTLHGHFSNPRQQLISEVIAGQYKVPMPAYLDLVDRKVNKAFMFAEAWWIISGNNRLCDIRPYMNIYANFSDDGIFLRGAYGPKIVDQMGHIVDVLEKDNDSRQAVLNIWRERPGGSKDIPCTTNMQFLIRDNKLDMVTTMRSHDLILGFTYDVFTFSMVAMSIKLLLHTRGIEVELGDLYVTAGSMHIYERHFEDCNDWIHSKKTEDISESIEYIKSADSYEELIFMLKNEADKWLSI